MARADLLCELIKYGLINDSSNFRKATEALCAEERSKQHTVLAAKIDELLKKSNKAITKDNVLSPATIRSGTTEQNLFMEKIPQKRLDHLILPNHIKLTCQDLITEQNRSDLLQSYGIEPRNKILLIGPPGNGKTSLAEAISEALMIPLLTVRYENIIGSYLGETASRLSRLFDYAKTRECVLFFDEFETLGKERGDTHETGEIKRYPTDKVDYYEVNIYSDAQDKQIVVKMPAEADFSGLEYEDEIKLTNRSINFWSDKELVHTGNGQFRTNYFSGEKWNAEGIEKVGKSNSKPEQSPKPEPKNNEPKK